MRSPIFLTRKEVQELPLYHHGGEVWEKSSSQKNLDILDFSSNTNPLGPPKNIFHTLNQNFWKIPYYPDSESRQLRSKISEKLNLNIENIIIGNGSCELIYLFTEVFIKKGEKAFSYSPTFVEYEKTVLKAGGGFHYVRMDENFTFTPDQFLKKIPLTAKIIFLCNPNNPTSTLIKMDEALKIVEYALNNEIMVFFDEDFMDFVSPNKQFSMIEYVDEYTNLFVIKSFTKIYSLAGLRVGYGIGNREVIQLLNRIKPPWNVNCLAQMAGIEALEDEEYISKTVKIMDSERKYLREALSNIDGLTVFTPEANFLFIRISKEDLSDSMLKQKLLDHHILIRDCSSFRGLDNQYIRVAVRSHEENRRLVDAMKIIIEETE